VQLVLVGCLLVSAGLAVACSSSAPQASSEPAAPLSAEAAAGRDLIVPRACGSCHRVPGVRDAVGTVGPSLAGIASRPKIAATVDNTPDNLKRWLLNPPAMKPGTSMPSLGLSDEDATKLTAFLETLK
jgi:cytochrome c2